jgi:predicted nuclease of predicted toxin-antitoxin system
MHIIIDTHLPRRLVALFQRAGHDATHTLDLPDQNRTTDQAIMHFADTHAAIVLTKDSDFVDAFFVQHRPQKLWLLSTGNITNTALEDLITANLDQIVALFQQHRFIELGRTDLIVHL